MTETRGPEIIAITSIFTGTAVIVVAIRFYAKAKKQAGTLGWDDLFILISIICGITDSICVVYPVTLGFGRHTAEVLAEPGGPARAVLAAKIQMIVYPFNILAFTLPNVAIAIFVHRCLDHRPWRVRLLWTMSVIQVVLALIPCIVIYCQCQPIDKLWNPRLPGSCWDPSILNNITYFLTAYTMLMDVVLAVMPIQVFWSLQMSKRTKISLCFMMSLTLLSAIITAVKASYLWLFTGSKDPLWDVVTLVNWGLVEQNVVVIAACVPPVRRVFSKSLRRATPTNSNSTKSTSNTASKFSMLSIGLFRGHAHAGRDGQHRSTPVPGGFPVATDIPLADQKGHVYVELEHMPSRSSAPSRPGILRTVGISVRSEDASCSQQEIMEDGVSVYGRGGPAAGRKGHFSFVER